MTTCNDLIKKLMSDELSYDSYENGQFYFPLATMSSNSLSRTPSSLLTSSHRHLTSHHHRGYVNNHETSLILTNAGVTSATALNATISSNNRHFNSASGERLSDTRQAIEDLEAKRLERRRLKIVDLFINITFA